MRTTEPRTMSTKVKTTRGHANDALEAYGKAQERDGFTRDVKRAEVGDLIADLLHVLDQDLRVHGEFDRAERDVEINRVLNGAYDHWHYESDPENADEEV